MSAVLAAEGEVAIPAAHSTGAVISARPAAIRRPRPWSGRVASDGAACCVGMVVEVLMAVPSEWSVRREGLSRGAPSSRIGRGAPSGFLREEDAATTPSPA